MQEIEQHDQFLRALASPARDANRPAQEEKRNIVRAKTRPKKVLRLFRQGRAQGGLTEPDVSLLLHLPINTISAVVLRDEREAGQTVPRRGTVPQRRGRLSTACP